MKIKKLELLAACYGMTEKEYKSSFRDNFEACDNCGAYTEFIRRCYIENFEEWLWLCHACDDLKRF